MPKKKQKKDKRQTDRKPGVGIVALACCDCGLVHKMGFTVNGVGEMWLDFERDAVSEESEKR